MGSAVAHHDISFDELCEIVAPIAEKHGVGRVYLFGSRARGDNEQSSDFDFLITLGQIHSLIKLGSLMCDLEAALGTSVDIVAEGPHLREEFKKEVLRDGKLVYKS